MAYVPPHHHTAEELLDAEIEDLLVDYRCALRDDLYEYAAEVAGKIVVLGIKRDCMKTIGDTSTADKARQRIDEQLRLFKASLAKAGR